jgi:hypothetical protein
MTKRLMYFCLGAQLAFLIVALSSCATFGHICATGEQLTVDPSTRQVGCVCLPNHEPDADGVGCHRVEPATPASPDVPSPEEPDEPPTPPSAEPSAQPTAQPSTEPPAPACGLPAMVQDASTRCEHVPNADGVYQADVIVAKDIVEATGLYTRDGSVTDRVGFLTSVAAELQKMGYCAEASGSLDEVAVKKDTNTFNEQYDLIEGDWESGKITLFLASTCRPARF